MSIEIKSENFYNLWAHTYAYNTLTPISKFFTTKFSAALLLHSPFASKKKIKITNLNRVIVSSHTSATSTYYVYKKKANRIRFTSGGHNSLLKRRGERKIQMANSRKRDVCASARSTILIALSKVFSPAVWFFALDKREVSRTRAFLPLPRSDPRTLSKAAYDECYKAYVWVYARRVKIKVWLTIWRRNLRINIRGWCFCPCSE